MTNVAADSQWDPPIKKKSNTGCLVFGIGGGCLLLTLLCGGGITVGVLGVFAAIKASEPYQESLRRAEQSPAIEQSLGQPIEASFTAQGNIQLTNNNGEADLNYMVTGPDGAAEIHVVGTKDNGVWSYQTMDATVNDGTVVDLLNADVSDLDAGQSQR